MSIDSFPPDDLRLVAEDVVRLEVAPYERDGRRRHIVDVPLVGQPLVCGAVRPHDS